MEKPYFFTWTKQEKAPHFALKGSSGVELFLQDGRKVVDLVSNSFQTAFGYDHPHLRKRISDQLNQFAVASPKAAFELKDIQTQRLRKLLGFQEGKVFYTVSGAEAIENALKMARHVSGKNLILARAKSYHGASIGAASVTGDWRHTDKNSISHLTIRIPEPDEDPTLEKTRKIIEQTGAENIAAFCLETISGANGALIPEMSWWRGIQNLCDQNNILLIVDEVTSGFYRTGTPFAFHHYDLKPNFVCMAKTISGGYIPFGAVWADEKVSKFYDQNVLSCGLTNYAHPLGLAAMQGVLDLLENETFQKNMQSLTETFASELESIKKFSCVKEIRVKGLLGGIILKDGANLSWQKAIDAGVQIYSAKELIVLMPAFVMTPKELVSAMRVLQNLLGE